MPANIIIAETGSKFKVTGIRRAIVAVGPNPGSTPTKVPNKTPKKQYHILAIERLIEKPKITFSEKTTSLKRYNSYETDEFGSATENPEFIKKNVEKRIKKEKEIEEEAKKFSQYKIYGKRDSKNVIVSWGSTKGAILDAIRGSSNDDLKKSSEGAIIDAIKYLDVKFVQVLYIEPFASEIKKELFGNLILIENNATGQLGDVIAEKTGMFIGDKNKILRYDGRPFLADELREEIYRRLK